MRRLITSALAGAALCVPLLVPATPAAGMPAPTAVAADDIRTDGPHSPTHRKPTAPRVTHRGGVATYDVDLGDVDLGRTAGQFRAPVRGLLITPDRPRARAPMIVVSHLRTSACLDEMPSYPCPKTEMRFDRGMAYFGEAMAKQGYAVLIPDLAPLWIGEGVATPYDQRKGWHTIVGRLRDQVVTAGNGRASVFGPAGSMRGMIDASRVGVLVHSRPGYITNDIVTGWARSTTPVDAVMAYAPAKMLPEIIGEFSPAPADVPWLSITGDADSDVPLDSRRWLAEYVDVSRRTPALDVVVPGFGHNYVNRELSRRGIDDRERSGASAAQHERLLVGAATDFFGATLRGRRTTLPLTATAPMPATIAGVPARWLASTPGPHRTLYTAGRHQRTLTTFGRGASARECRYNPETVGRGPHAPLCTDAGDIRSMSTVARVRLTSTAGVRARSARPARGVREVVLQVAPTGPRANATALRVTLLAGSRRIPLTVPATDAALLDRGSGLYATSTLRIRVPAWVRGQAVTGVELTSRTTTRLDLRSVDLVTAG